MIGREGNFDCCRPFQKFCCLFQGSVGCPYFSTGKGLERDDRSFLLTRIQASIFSLKAGYYPSFLQNHRNNLHSAQLLAHYSSKNWVLFEEAFFISMEFHVTKGFLSKIYSCKGAVVWEAIS